MKYSRIFFRSLCALAVAVSATACDDDDLIVGGADTNGYLTPDGNVIYITDAKGNREFTNTEFVGNGSVDLFANSSKPVSGCSVTFSVDPTVLAAYNEENATSYTQLPDASFSLGNNGQAAFTDGSLKSAPMTISLKGNTACSPDVTYAIPLRISVSNGQLSQTSIATRVVLVRDLTKRPGADKYVDGKPAMKTMAVIEVNDRNPLSVLGYTLENSGKQLFDIVVLFSANINYNAETGRIYVSRNENVQALLDQREKYIKPLQDKGIKVVLGILGNHDASGVSTLTPASSKAFAQEVKNVCDAYQLDGVFLDDEYTDYDAAALDKYQGIFQPYSQEAVNRMAYDIKKAQPDRLVIGYKYGEKFGNYLGGVTIDGTKPGEFWDYVCNNYWDTANPCDTFEGLRQDQAGTGSWNCSDWAGCMPAYQAWQDRFSLAGMRADGYGIMMIFNFYNDPGHWLTYYINDWLGASATNLYDERLVIADDVYKPKDW